MERVFDLAIAFGRAVIAIGGYGAMLLFVLIFVTSILCRIFPGPARPRLIVEVIALFMAVLLAAVTSILLRVTA